VGDLSVRDATLEDIPALARLRWEFRREHGDVSPNASFEEFGGRFLSFAREALRDDRWRAQVAERDGRLVGTMWLQLVPKVPAPSAQGDLIGYVTNAYVKPEEREHGVGRLLLDRLVEIAGTLPVEFLMTWPTQRSEPFYERAGFERSGSMWQRYLIRDPYGVWPGASGPTGE
jgi:GNAT superfamily N-acetyltransferase